MMAKIYKLTTRNGREFRVVVTNENQEKRLRNTVAASKGKYEELTLHEPVLNGIHDIKSFEKLAESLQ